MSFAGGPHVPSFALGDVPPEGLDDDVDQMLRSAASSMRGALVHGDVSLCSVSVQPTCLNGPGGGGPPGRR
ncbi:MAG: hypothetical protein M3186_12665, partial [Actinomycetota bacterium]|nr:hypothetical protein [Actinomycetota bacterium]